MSGYLELAQKAIKESTVEPSEEQLAERRQRRLKGADRRGLVARWGEYPPWLALRDPLSEEWHELWATDCFLSLVEEDERRTRGRLLRKKRRKEE